MNDRHKQLRKLYKEMKSSMGVFIIRNRRENKCFIDATNDLRGTMNGARFRLETGSHFNQQLQQAWRQGKPDDFEFAILDNLEYSQDESKTDYKDDLATLKTIWQDKLKEESGLEFYIK